MKSITNAYKKSMNSILRNPSHAEIVFSNINVEAQNDGEWSDNGHLDYSSLSYLDLNHTYMDNVATLELNRWLLDGYQQIYPQGSDCYISSYISNEDGMFSTKPTITKTFTVPYNLVALTLTFDTRLDEFPIDITVNYYDVENELLSSQSVRVDEVEFIVDGEDNVKKIEIVFGKTLPYRRARFESSLYGRKVTFTDKDIVSVRQSHDVDPLSRRLPKETFEFTVIDIEHKYDPDNVQGIYDYVEKKSPIYITFGYEITNKITEWLKPDYYLLDSKPTVKNNTVTFKATGLVNSMSDTFYKGKVGRKNLYDMAIEVLEDANLSPTAEGNDPWEIDEQLKSIYTDGILPINTHMNCLQLIAHASRSRLYTDDDNIIHIKPFGTNLKNFYMGNYADTGHLYYSDWENVSVNDNTNTYATLELNRWLLDGQNTEIIPDEEYEKKGYISSEVSDSDGAYKETSFIRTFEVKHDLSLININFDEILEEYPTNLTIKYYSDNVVKDEQTIKVTGTFLQIISRTATDINKIEITIKNGLPYRRCRVTQMYFRETDFSLTLESIKENTQVTTKVAELKEVQVTRYNYSSDVEEKIIYETDTSEEQLHIELDSLNTDIRVQLDKGSVIQSNIYAKALDLVLSSGQKHITIYGKKLTENKSIISYPINRTGEVDKEDNRLITSEEMANELAIWVSDYLQIRNTYDCEYRGNPELEVGDIIGYQSKFTRGLDVLILTDEISYSGALSGKLKVKGLI